jgi:RNA polymerase sigma-70 factor (ECF subfamily)
MVKMDTATQKTHDAWIALRCQLGEPGAFEALVAEMERPLLYYAARLTRSDEVALDVLQEVWIRVFHIINRLREPAALRTWLYRIVRGVALNHVRDETTRRHAEEAAADELDPATAEPEFDTVDVTALHEALDELDDKHREALVLHFLEELSIEEIATVVACPPGTVKSRIHYAKRALARRLEVKHDES